ncbi:MAG TPA: hypothetical protein VGC38_05470 [Pseudolabrys sp.]
MTHSDKPPSLKKPLAAAGGERPFSGRLMQGMLITAIVVLIAIAVVSFR